VSTVKAHRFPVTVQWAGDRLTNVRVAGKPLLPVATPPEFRGTHPDVWSPEDLLVGALASCYAVTLVSVAEWRKVPLFSLRVDGLGHVERRRDGRFAFVAIDLRASIATDEGSVAAAEDAARYAKDACLVGVALDTPVHLELEVAASERPAA